MVRKITPIFAENFCRLLGKRVAPFDNVGVDLLKPDALSIDLAVNDSVRPIRNFLLNHHLGPLDVLHRRFAIRPAFC
jgi:hypothetical protein